MHLAHFPPTLPSSRTLFGIIIAFFALTFAIYGHSLRYDFVRWDDGLLVYENPAVRAITPTTIKHVFTTYDPELYIPLTFLTYQLEFQIAGAKPWLYHLDNIILHTLNALCVAWLAFLLLRRRGTDEGVEGSSEKPSLRSSRSSDGWIALFLGVLFAVHPLHTEAVEWVSARKDLLSTLFFLLSIISYIRWREYGWRRMLIWSVAAFVLGLMAKVMIITLPVILLLIDWLAERRLFSVEQLKEKIPYVIAALIFGLVAIYGKTDVISSTTPWMTFLMAFRSTVFYIHLFLIPTGLSVLYPYYGPVTLASPDFFIPIIAIIILAAVVFWTLRKTRAVAFGAAFFLITLLPTFVNFSKGDTLYVASDRYAYIPSIGILFLIALLLSHLIQKLRSDRPITIPGIAIVLLLSFLSWHQSQSWKDSETLFANVLAHYPRSHIAHNNMGNIYRLQNRYDEAHTEYQEALSVVPEEILKKDAMRSPQQALQVRSYAKTLSNLGALYRKQGKITEALAAYQKALEIDPRSKEGHFGLGIVYASQQQYTDAEASYQKALAIDPRYEEAYTNLGAILMAQKKTADAIVAYRKALAINPSFPDANYNLAIALSEQGNAQEAIAAYQRTISIVPGFIPARLNLGLLLHQAGNLDEAQDQFEAVLRLDPTNPAARSALQQMGIL